MAEITGAIARRIIDSRGSPTVEIDIISNSIIGRAAAPSGASKGTFEVKDYPSGGVDSGIKAFEKVARRATGMRLSDQEGFDAMLHETDGTADFGELGGNVTVAASLAYAKASAKSENTELYKVLAYKNNTTPSLPRPMGNMIGGGKHAINGTTMQEFLSIAYGKSYADSAFANVSVHKKVGELLRAKFPQLSLGLGDEKAWVAPLNDDEALDVLSSAIRSASEEADVDIDPAVDLAASEFCDNGTYSYRDRMLSAEEQIDFVAELAQKFGIRSLEDPLNESDFEGFVELTKRIGKDTMIIGDDLFVTNKERLQKGISMGAANAILIKPNQIGTLSDMIETVMLAKRNNYQTIISHRSGETEDSTIAHLAVGLGIGYIKTGTIGGERTAKHNELIRIEEQLQSS